LSGPKPWPDVHASFRQWLSEKFTPSHQAEMWEDFLELGEYPEEFLDWWRDLIQR